MGTREWQCPSCFSIHDRDLNAAQNILNFGQIDVCDHTISSRATSEVELKIPKALMKMIDKIERSSAVHDVNHGIEQARRSLDVEQLTVRKDRETTFQLIFN